MKAIRVTTLTGPGDIELAEADRPSPGPGQVLIEVAFAGVTFPDLLQTRGMYQTKHALPFVLGSEVAGIVAEAGPGSAFSVGDRVAAIPGVGSFAEFVVADDEQTVPVPAAIGLGPAAGMPMNLLTADFALRVRAKAEPGQTVLVHGATGGLGASTVQLALAMGLDVIAVVSTRDKAAVAAELGATHVIMAEGFKDAVRALMPEGVDIVVDPVGGDRFTDSLRSLALFGQLLVLGFTAGEIPTVKVNRLLLGNTAVVGVGWGGALRGKPGFIAGQWEGMAEHLAAGRLTPRIHATYPLAEAASALRELDTRAVLGKVIVEVAGE